MPPPLPILPALLYAFLGAITGPLLCLLAVLPPDVPPPPRKPYPIAEGNDPDPPPHPQARQIQREVMREYQRTHRRPNS